MTLIIVVTIISDTMDKKVFSLLDSEGNDISGKQQLGLLLYGGRTVCVSDRKYFNFKAADAICREMNYTRATYWTSFSKLFDIRRQYYPNLSIKKCDRAEWKSCSYSEYSCRDTSYALHLNCTGNFA